MIILDVNKIAKNFGFGNILNDVSFSLNEGERVAIVGNNGCGKSTLLKIICGKEKQDAGIVSIKKDACVEYLEQGDVSDSREGIVIDILQGWFLAWFTPLIRWSGIPSAYLLSGCFGNRNCLHWLYGLFCKA